MQLPPCVFPIHRQVNAGKLESIGSVTLLRAVDFRMLFSAAHVLLDDPLWLPGKPKFIPLDSVGRVFTTSKDLASARTDRQDVGFVVMDPWAADALEAQGAEFLSVSRTTLGQGAGKPERFVCSGFPWRKSRDYVRGEITNTRMDISERALTEEELVRVGLDPRLHLAVHYDRFTVEHEGQRMIGSLPHGMSGGCLWQVSADSSPVLAAIATDYDERNQLIRGTRIEPVLFEARRRIREMLGTAA